MSAPPTSLIAIQIDKNRFNNQRTGKNLQARVLRAEILRPLVLRFLREQLWDQLSRTFSTPFKANVHSLSSFIN